MISVLIDTASDFLYHSVIHDIQLRNTLCRRCYLWVVYFSFYKPLQALVVHKYLLCLQALFMQAKISRYLDVGNVNHTTLLQTLLFIHYFTGYFNSRIFQPRSVMPIDLFIYTVHIRKFSAPHLLHSKRKTRAWYAVIEAALKLKTRARTGVSMLSHDTSSIAIRYNTRCQTRLSPKGGVPLCRKSWLKINIH